MSYEHLLAISSMNISLSPFQFREIEQVQSEVSERLTQDIQGIKITLKKLRMI